jgi:hypothetical protein
MPLLSIWEDTEVLMKRPLFLMLAAVLLAMAGMLAVAQDTEPAPPAQEPQARPDEPENGPEEEAEQPEDWQAELEKLMAALEEGEPAFTLEDVQEYAKQLIPLVEETAGRKFKQTPDVRLGDREEVADALARDFVPQLKNMNPGIDEGDLKEVAENEARAMAMVLLGKYALEDRVVYLMPRNVDPLFKLGKVDRKHVKPILQLVIAHELTHALQFEDEKLVERFRSVRTMEQMQALNATIEGHAVLIQDMVGGKLGLDDSVLELSRLMAAGSMKLDDPGLNLLNNLIAAQYEQIYMSGRKFMEYHFEKGGNEALWKILAAPPVKTSMISKPETYAADFAGPKIDYAKLLEGLEDEFGDEEWAVQNLEIGDIMLRSVYANMDKEERDRIMGNIVHVQGLIAQLTDGRTMGNVSIFVLKDGEMAQKMMTALEKMARDNIGRLKGSTMFKITDVAATDIEGVEARVARKFSFTISPTTGEGFKQAISRIFRGNVMVEIWESNLELDGKEIVGLAEKVFKRFAEAMKPEKESEEPAEEPAEEPVGEGVGK